MGNYTDFDLDIKQVQGSSSPDALPTTLIIVATSSNPCVQWLEFAIWNGEFIATQLLSCVDACTNNCPPHTQANSCDFTCGSGCR